MTKAHDATGKPVPEGTPGSVVAPRKEVLRTKYSGESRFECGCMIAEYADGRKEGKRLPTFDYSERKLDYIGDCCLLTAIGMPPPRRPTPLPHSPFAQKGHVAT